MIFTQPFTLVRYGRLCKDACIYSNLSTKIFLRTCLFCWDPDCCKNRFHPGTCVYSNLETKTLLQQSRDPKCYSNMEPVHSWSYIVFYNFSTLQHFRSNLGMSSKSEIDHNWKSKFLRGLMHTKNFPIFRILFGLVHSQT